MEAGNVSALLRVGLWILGLLLGVLGGALLVGVVLVVTSLPEDGLSGLIGSLKLDARLPWYLTRASGTVGYVLLSASTAWGLILSTRITKEVTPAPFSLAIHNAMSWIALATAGYHAWLLLLDSYYVYLPADLLVPFTGPYRPGWVGLGTISLYLMFVLSASFAWRKFIGQNGWRLLHYLSFPVFILVTIHGLKAGTDSGLLGMQILFWGSGLVTLFLTTYRVATAAEQRGSRQRGG